MASVAKKAKRDKSDADLKSPTAPEEKDTRSFCERVDCAPDQLVCCIQVCSECFSRRNDILAAPTHNWSHLSLGEHVCIMCMDFFTKSNRPGHDEYLRWRRTWMTHGRIESASLATFISDQLLPYWTQCIRCAQWREMGRFFLLTTQINEQFICINGCDEVEDSRVLATKESHWINTLLYPPYLQNSPAASFLKAWFPDLVGLSASEPQPESGSVIENLMRPFQEPPNNCHALGLRPDVMDLDETLAFPEFACAQQMYLCLRNLVVAMWVKNSSDWLTMDRCKHNVICRGLVRLRCVQDLERIIIFLTKRSVIHFGILPHPPPIIFSDKVPQQSVIIIGAGIAGLAAGQHLYKHGIKPIILEAKDKLGGRVHATKLANGSLLSLGPDIISGSINNPVAIAARQAKLIVQEYSVNNMVVFTKNNKTMSAETMRKAENRLLEILDLATLWRNENRSAPDISLQDKIEELNEQLDAEDGNSKLTADERIVLKMHVKLLTHKFGCGLHDLSALHWNSYEEYPQFPGASFVVKQGLGALLMKMVAGLTVNYKKQVVDVSVEAGQVVVNCRDGEHFIADKVINTIPLSCLKTGNIVFKPQLPVLKLDAINRICCARLEKVVLHFKKKFWAPKLHGVRIFTSVSLLESNDHPMHVFYDMSNNMGHVLTAFYLYSPTSAVMRSEETIITNCLEALHKVFPNAHEPVSTSVSCWTNEPFAGSSGSYVPVGTSDELYDVMAQPVYDCIHFAGEATIRSHRHTLAGAYLSGVREAVRILDG